MSSCLGLRGWKYPPAPLPQRPSEHTLGLSAGSSHAFGLLCQDTFCDASLITWFVALEVTTAGKGIPKGLGFPRARQRGAAAVAVYAGLHRTTWQPPPLPFLHQAGLQLLAPTTPVCSPRHTTLPPKRPPLPTPLPWVAVPKPIQPPGSAPCSPSCLAASVFGQSCELHQHKG